MVHWGTSSHRQEFLSTGRLVTWGALLVVAGIAAPVLRTGQATSSISRAARAEGARAEKTPLGAGVAGVENRVKTFTTESRMRGIRAELKMWVQRNGTTPTGPLPRLVGERTAQDAWGRNIQYLAPTASSRGWLRSKGPDPKTDKDDIWLPLALNDLR